MTKTGRWEDVGRTQEGVEGVLSTEGSAGILLLEVDGGDELADGGHRRERVVESGGGGCAEGLIRVIVAKILKCRVRVLVERLTRLVYYASCPSIQHSQRSPYLTRVLRKTALGVPSKYASVPQGRRTRTLAFSTARRPLQVYHHTPSRAAPADCLCLRLHPSFFFLLSA